MLFAEQSMAIVLAKRGDSPMNLSRAKGRFAGGMA
jgi:hypothetical protein